MADGRPLSSEIKDGLQALRELRELASRAPAKWVIAVSKRASWARSSPASTGRPAAVKVRTKRAAPVSPVGKRPTVPHSLLG